MNTEILMNKGKDTKKMGTQNEYPKFHERLVNIVIYL